MRYFLVAAFVLTAGPVVADCAGRDLIAEMSSEQRARLTAAVSEVPYHRGLLWQATRDDARIVLVGTYHFPDPRHDRIMARLEQPFKDAALLVVEAGPAEEALLKDALQNDPALAFDHEGPTLPERLEDAEWQRLAAAIEDRGIPAVLASRMRPWYISLLLGVSPCMVNQLAQGGDAAGLDRMLMDKAEALDLPIRALEPWNTVFSLFAGLTPEQEIDMIRANLPAAEYADDYAATLTEAYFDEDVWRIWEFSRIDAYETSGLSKAVVDEQMELAQSLLMDQRNENWIEPLTKAAEEAAANGGIVIAGFGALHLPGERGVLKLLENDGWSIERLDE